MRAKPVNSKALQRSWLWSSRASLRRYADIFFVKSAQPSSPPHSSTTVPAVHQPARRNSAARFCQSQQIFAVSLALGPGTSCLHVRQSSDGRRQNRCMPFLSATACIWMLRFNNLKRWGGQGPAEGAPPLGVPAKGHLSA